MLAEWLKNVLDTTSYANLLSKKQSFTFMDTTNGTQRFGGLVMLKIMLDELDSQVIVSVELLFQNLKRIHMHEYKNDVDDLCNAIRTYMKQI